jgi:F0F1-type ATP synthase membrane subunit b/b'
MGRKLTPDEETRALRELIREAHEATQALRAAIREAAQLSATLTQEYQRYHDRELKQLANALTVEHNQVSADLNASVERARIMISEQIMAGKAVFDADTSTVTVSWGNGAFDDQQPLPYPEATLQEKTQ